MSTIQGNTLRYGRCFILLLLSMCLSSSWANQQEKTHEMCANGFCSTITVMKERAMQEVSLSDQADVAVFPFLMSSGNTTQVSKVAGNKLGQVGSGNIAVLYPNVGEPFRSIFGQIISGIEAKAKGRVANIPVGDDTNIGEIVASLRNHDVRVVIALGRQGLKIAASLDNNISVVVGGVLGGVSVDGKNLKVNSLSPDPALLFARLKQMMPQVKRVHVVYDPKQNEWLARLAKEAAKTLKIEFVGYEARDIRSAVKSYQDIFAVADNKQDALWLMQDTTTVDENAVLPFVLQESWARNLAIFSSSFSHVKRGVLFSLYPNNAELGQFLASSALDVLASGSNQGTATLPLREVLMAVNLRTAKHLGLTDIQPHHFDMVFPER